MISHFEILSEEEVDRRMQSGLDEYFINMLDGRTLDSRNTPCFAKYANDADGLGKHSLKNNAKIGLDENDQICLIATRKIKSGEEVLCGYGKKYWGRLKMRLE